MKKDSNSLDQLKFSDAQQTDLEEISSLLTGAFTIFVARLGKTQSGHHPWLAGAIAENRVHIARDGKAIVGAICTTMTSKRLEIDKLGVDPKRQGNGIGSWMLKQLEAHARERGAQTLTLYTGAMMEDLLRFYGSHGFVETHRALPEHGDDNHLRAHMEKQL